MSEIFEHTIAYVEDLGSFAPHTPRGAGVTGLAIKLYEANGDNRFVESNARYLETQGSFLRQRGYSLGAWAVPRAKPETAAFVVSALYGRFGLSFAVFETEWEYRIDGGGVDVARLLGPWRAKRPNAYTGLAVEGGPPATFNWRAALDYGARILPENYWLQDGAYDATACFGRCRALGLPLERVHPTLSGVEGHSLSEAIIRAYAARSAGFTRGVCIWRGDLLSAEDYRLLSLARGLSL